MKDVEYFSFRVPNEIPGRKPYLVRWKLTAEEAARLYPDATVEPGSREVRQIPSTPEEAFHIARSPEPNFQPTEGAHLREYGARLKQMQAAERAAYRARPRMAPTLTPAQSRAADDWVNSWHPDDEPGFGMGGAWSSPPPQAGTSQDTTKEPS